MELNYGTCTASVSGEAVMEAVMEPHQGQGENAGASLWLHQHRKVGEDWAQKMYS